MAVTFQAKPSGSVHIEYWSPELDDGDTLSSATLTVSSGDAVIDSYSVEGDTVKATVSAGTAGTTTLIAATAITNAGETLTDIIYLPVVTAGSVLGYTVRDICNAVLRPVAGIGETPDADELDIAVEYLNDILAQWNVTGAALGAPIPVAAGDTLYISDSFQRGLKANLKLAVMPEFVAGWEPSSRELMAAQAGLVTIKWALLPDVRAAEYF